MSKTAFFEGRPKKVQILPILTPKNRIFTKIRVFEGGEALKSRKSGFSGGRPENPDFGVLTPIPGVASPPHGVKKGHEKVKPRGGFTFS